MDMTADQTLQESCMGALRHMGVEVTALVDKTNRLEAENAKLRELACKQDALTKAVHAYWAGGEGSLDDFNVMMDANAQVLTLMRNLGIEAGE